MSGWNLEPPHPRRTALRRDQRRCGPGNRLIGTIFPGVLAFAVLLFSSACGKKSVSSTSASSQVLRLSQRNEPGDLDPATVTVVDEFFVIRALSEGLVTPAPKGGQRPAAADHWEISADHLTYTFHLRPNGRWSNGEPVVAQDFVESYRRALTPATAGPKADVFFPVKNAQRFLAGEISDFAQVGFRAADPFTLVVTLEQTTPAFLAYAASGPWIPVNPRTVAQYGRNWTRPGNFVGNGPFVLTEWHPHQRIVARRNPHYGRIANVKLDEIDFVAFDNSDVEEHAYRTGQIDLTMDVPTSKIDGYLHEHPTEFVRTPLAETRYLTLNAQHPPLNDARVRRALSLTVDRERITAKVTLNGQPATTLTPPVLLAAKDLPNLATPKVPAKEDAVREARALLAAAGFPGGRGFPVLEMSCWSRGQTPTLEAIQAMWKADLGIDVTLTTREARVHIAALHTGNYDIGYITLIPDVADPIAPLFYLTSGYVNNYGHWSNARYDAAVAQATHAADAPAQLPFIAEAETVIADEAPVIPLLYNVKKSLVSPRVHGWQQDALWTPFYSETSVDEK